MNNNTSSNGYGTCLALTLALLTGLPACGDLDETDANPPAVNALAAWDPSHLVALRTYYKEPVIVDAQTGKQTGTLSADKWYQDIAVIGDGEWVGLQNQAIDFYKSDGTLDADRSITATQFTEIAMSADRATLAYAAAIDPTSNSIGILDLPSGAARSPVPDVSFNYGLSISRDGNLVAFISGWLGVAMTPAPVGVAMTHAPWTTSTCVPASDEQHPCSPLGTAFSPVGDKLAVECDGGGVNIFDLGHFPDCTLVSSFVSPAVNSPSIAHVAYSPDASILAVSVEQIASNQAGVPIASTGVIRLLDASTGTVVKELPVYEWQMTADPSNYGPLITDVQWSATGDRLSVSTSNGPVEQWDVATGKLLWTAKL